MGVRPAYDIPRPALGEAATRTYCYSGAWRLIIASAVFRPSMAELMMPPA